MKEKFRVIYTGKLEPKTDVEHAVERISKSFNISKDHAVSFLSSEKTRVVKKNLSLDQAEKYRLVLSRIGLIINVVQEENDNSEKAQHIQKEPQHNEVEKTGVDEKDLTDQNESISEVKNEPLANKTRRKIIKVLILIGIILVSIGIGLFLLFPDFPQKTYTQDETYRKKKVWYNKETDELLNGVLILKDQNGQLQAKVTFQDGVQNGIYKAFYPNSGALMLEVMFVNGQKHGKAITMSEAGYLVGEGYYVNGKEDGEHRRFRSSSGALEHRTVYDNGKYVLSESYRTDGKQLAYRTEFENGVQVRNLHYFASGQISLESTSKDGYSLKDIHYYDTGEVNSYTYYDKGKRKFAEYLEKSGEPYLKIKYKNGKEAHRYEFRNGVLVSEIIINNGIEERIEHKTN